VPTAAYSTWSRCAHRPGAPELDQEKRRQLYAQLQRILAEDLPSINLWYLDNVLVHSQRVTNLSLNPPGNYDFLRTAQITSN
jgi:peptide/nickel transport system substrate-binding protein